MNKVSKLQNMKDVAWCFFFFFKDTTVMVHLQNTPEEQMAESKFSGRLNKQSSCVVGLTCCRCCSDASWQVLVKYTFYRSKQRE